ncbi:MAG: hypothetical protein ABIR54_18795 [Burkholderiaceae bacterium]
MIRTETRLRLLWLTVACATFAAPLTGCGGGGGAGSTPTPAPSPPAPAPSESAWLLAEFVAGDSNSQTVRVWDPAHPAVAIQSVRLVQSNGIVWTASHLVFSDARTYDATTHTVTTLGHAKVFYDNDGKLYSIDLRGGQSHVPVQLSSAVDVFLPVGATPMNAGGDDAWVDVQGGSHHWAIRTSMAATTAPVSVLRIIAPLRDAGTGLPQYFFASLGAQSGIHVTPTSYQVFDATFTPVAVPEVAAMATTDGWVGVDPAQAGLGYARVGGHLRELHWSAGSVTVDASPLYTFVNGNAMLSSVDAQSLYFTDGGALSSVANGQVQSLGTFTATPSALIDAGSYIAASEITAASATQTYTQVETVRKSDGHVTLVESATLDLTLLGSSQQGLVIGGTTEAATAVSLVSGDATMRTTLGAGLQYVGAVRSASARVDQQAAPVAVLACVASGVGDFCAAGALTQLSLAGTSTALGNIAAATSWTRGDAMAGLTASLSGQTFLSATAGFGSGETDRRDAWQFTPASAGSVTRITSNLP